MAPERLQAKLSPSTSLQYLKGVGPERLKILGRLGLLTLKDLLYFFPRRYEDRSPVKTVSEAGVSEKECVSGTLASRALVRLRGGQTILRAVLTDGKKSLLAVWFNQPYLLKALVPKCRIIVYGKTETAGRQLQITHPEYEIMPDDDAVGARRAVPLHTGRIVPIYGLTEDLSQKGLRQLSHRALEALTPIINDPLPPAVKKRHALVERRRAFNDIHFPSDFAARERAYKRLVFDEFFAMQLAVHMRRTAIRKDNPSLSHTKGKDEVKSLVASLPFELTAGQAKAVKQILADMSSTKPMNRLVQGDVGSGKTAVAAAALAFTAANGFQGALMAPTEVLAQQQFFSMTQLLEPLGIRCGYLAQSQPAPDRVKVLQALADGTIQVAVGTHALIQGDVRFKNLGLAVVDEQHKFGVFQRAALPAKGGSASGGKGESGRCHFLLMTATPIPRTLCQTLYGDLDVSIIAEVPKGRKLVRTMWVEEHRRAEIYGFVDRYVESGGQAYVICPHVDSNQSVGVGAGLKPAPTTVKNVLDAHKELSQALSKRTVAVLHGRMKAPEKTRIMNEFKAKKIDVLVSTVVIEVGVDVPNANLMIIENAEKFGLAQLHQLRGRVGRGDQEATCVLFAEMADEATSERLDVFQKTSSGFELSEKDLAMRGGGDIVGERQHGLPELRIGDFVRDGHILEAAREEAGAVIAADPLLDKPENKLLKRLVADRFGSARKAAEAVAT